MTTPAWKPLADEVVIVTGAGRGIGRAVALRFAAQGAKVIVATRSKANAQDTVDLVVGAGNRASMFLLDVGDPTQVKALVQETLAAEGRIDVVVHNAAHFSSDQLEAMTPALLDRMLAVNLSACFHLTRWSIEPMRKQGTGRILVTSSVTGPRVAMPRTSHYAASKAGVNGFIRSAALELAPYGITVNGVEPGYIDTPTTAHFVQRYGLEAVVRHIPLRRLGRPEEVAAALAFLASPEAAYITGQTIIVDGGSTLPESPVFSENLPAAEQPSSDGLNRRVEPMP
ncbi:MAG: SDR family oxidoreductase [Acidimicrobiales bacterium]